MMFGEQCSIHRKVEARLLSAFDGRMCRQCDPNLAQEGICPQCGFQVSTENVWAYCPRCHYDEFAPFRSPAAWGSSPDPLVLLVAFGIMGTAPWFLAGFLPWKVTIYLTLGGLGFVGLWLTGHFKRTAGSKPNPTSESE
jgi:hypothetical protein